MTNRCGRVTNRVKRQLLAQVTPIKWAADGKHEQRRRDWAPYLPQLALPEAAIVMELNRVAIRVNQLDDLNVPTTDQRLADQALWHWGLQEPLLDLVENTSVSLRAITVPMPVVRWATMK